MYLGLLTTSIPDTDHTGYYNNQDMGVAKELDRLCDKVVVYRAVSKDNSGQCRRVEGCRDTTLCLVPSRKYGSNGLLDPAQLDKNLDALVYFSDTQLSVPKVYRWCKKNHIKLLPYIGVTESHSISKLKKIIMDVLFRRNVAVYRNCSCLAKTPQIVQTLEPVGCSSCTIAPVGLNIELLHTDYAATPVPALKRKWGFKDAERVLLFIGRLVPEKDPLRMLDIFQEAYQRDQSFRLLMVGEGVLHDELVKKIHQWGLAQLVRLVPRVPNAEIWELYRLGDAFVNLNRQEIFGMSILEAMYYECRVVAWHAPGPDYILKNQNCGVLCSTNDEILEAVMNPKDASCSGKMRVLSDFTWKRTAEKIIEQIR